MARTQKMKKLEELRDDLRRQIEVLQHQLAGVEMSIRTVSGAQDPQPPQQRRRSNNVKQTLLDFLEEVRQSGLNATIAVDMAARRQEQLEKATVSSLLSRFKSQGLVTYDGSVYRLTKYQPVENPVH